MATKDEKNLQQVLQKIASMDESVRPIMQRMHEVIVAAAPDLKPRIWYGMPGYARSASSPVLVFFRKDECMTLGISEKVAFRPAGGDDGLLMPAAWYFEGLDAATEARVTEIVRAAAA
ncbi:DUF1801 domain-containing protein [Brevibacterium litoralis]|uniref:DUF1801 domain-containing protein n=1 Tax=Brevibacterium litoralis TaxID=3138935 RepID=UPI0032EC43DD